MTVNRIRYVRKFHPSVYAAAFRGAVMLSALLRAHKPQRGVSFAAASMEKSWQRLPHAELYSQESSGTRVVPFGAVIIPAHNEAAVLGRTLTALKGAMATGRLEVIVACNGCTDGTEEVARSVSGVRVIEVADASKIAALNAGDRAASRWPRLYLDADIELPLEALCATLDALSTDQGALCARPAFRYDSEGASWPVRSYYRARSRLPQASGSMWGAGVYGLSLRGHRRLGVFPVVTADDCYVDRMFERSEKVVLACQPVTVRTPRTGRALLSTLKRVYRGNSELGKVPGVRTALTVRELAASIGGPASALDVLVYVLFAIAGRWRLGVFHESAWERDNSSRTG